MPQGGVLNETTCNVEFNDETLNNTTVSATPLKTLNVNAVVSNA